MMTQLCLRLYSTEGRQYQGKMLHIYLLQVARNLGVGGGTVIRASAGFGRHGLADAGFFDLGGELPEVIEFVATQTQVDALLALCHEHQFNLFYIVTPVTTGYTG
ncbi:MAG: DUF190 domain-containing protein [Sulfuriferula sp.]|nr:DUF190 domain-containing protein [Sulfuriferula sp.]